jgi:hypothetical protein
MPSAEAEPQQVFRKIEPHEHLGRKGRSLPGSHRSHGLFVACGPTVASLGRLDPHVSVHIADASATLLARMNVAPTEQASGRVLPILSHPPALDATREQPGNALRAGGTNTNPDAQSGVRAHSTDSTTEAASGDERRVAERLRSLGYIE